MRGSSAKLRVVMPVYVVAALEFSPQELNSARCTTFLALLMGNEKSASPGMWARAFKRGDRIPHT